MKIDNEELWTKIKNKQIRGLSIEGFFADKFEAMQKRKPTDLEILSALNEIIKENKKQDKKQIKS
jgi:hypothetical protein